MLLLIFTFIFVGMSVFSGEEAGPEGLFVSVINSGLVVAAGAGSSMKNKSDIANDATHVNKILPKLVREQIGQVNNMLDDDAVEQMADDIVANIKTTKRQRERTGAA